MTVAGKITVMTGRAHFWLQISLEATPKTSVMLSEALSLSGAISVTLTDQGDTPIYEPPPQEEILWNDTRVIGLFEPGQDPTEILDRIRTALGTNELPAYQLERIEDRDWVRAWMQDFRPMRFGDRLWICPSTHAPPDPEACTILLDPGLAFGTGTHPTTALCLEWLDANDVRDLEVIDYGCGSGVLAIAAAKLGARTVTAVDLDPQALAATHDNAARNALADRIVTRLPDAPAPAPADLLLANILAKPLIELAPRFRHWLKPGRPLVLSGILTDQVDDILAGYQRWFELRDITVREEWARITMALSVNAGDRQ